MFSTLFLLGKSFFYLPSKSWKQGEGYQKGVFALKRLSVVLLLAFTFLSVGFWTGCSTPGNGWNIALSLLQPGPDGIDIDLQPEFSWEIQFEGSPPRVEPFFRLFVSPLGQEFGEGLSTNETVSQWPELLEAGGQFHWMVELSLEGQVPVQSEERLFSTRNYYVVQVQVEQATGGEIRLDGGEWGNTFTLDAQAQQPIVLEARSQPDYLFDGWYSGDECLGTDNPFEYTPSLAMGSSPRTESDLQLQARFSKKQVTLVLQASPSDHGQVRIDEGAWAPEARLTVDAGQEVALQAIAAEGFHFEGWILLASSGIRGQQLGDQNPLPFSPADNCTVLASFAPDTYTVTLESSPTNGGNVRINNGQWGRTQSEEFLPGSQVEARALGVSGYAFEGWFESGQLVSQDPSYDWEVQGNRALVASFFQPPVPVPLVQKWVYSPGSAIYSSPALASDGTIYIAAGTKLYAVNPDGTQKWAFTTVGQITTSPTVGKDGTIFVSPSKYVYAVKTNGTEKWEWGSNRAYHSPVFFDNANGGNIYVSSLDGFTFGRRASDYNACGSYNTGSGILSEPSSDGSFLYISTDNGILYAFKIYLYSYEKEWIFTGDSKMQGNPAFASDGTVYLGTTTQLYALDPTQEPGNVGDEEWKFPGTGKSVDFSRSKPVVAQDGTIYAPSAEGLYAINPNGTLKWRFGSTSISNAPLVGDNGTVYAVFSSGHFCALNPEDGSERWSCELGSAVSASPAMADDGTLYIATENGDLLAYTSYSTGLAESSWPKFQGDAANTGTK